MDTLSKLFGSEAKVKIMRLFLFNPDQPYSPNEIAQRARVSVAVVRHETTTLRRMGMIKGKRFSHNVPVKKGKVTTIKKKTEGGWVLNSAFPYLLAIQNLLINTSLFRHDDLIRKLNAVGKMKLVIVSGVFTRDAESRVDLLVVGDSVRFAALENVVRTIESEIGKELKYAAFETADFEYRLGMYDKLIRDILDFPHKKILSRLNVPFN
ncbi:MAG: hypothetical protein EXS47_01700 [Candidatus Zambryskibacteria bacterium]|nr:hypothetical protein [Candidatus Zambryskibacteria bacterium]